MSKTVQVDDSRWPLVTVRFFGDATDEDFEAYLRALNDNMNRTEAAGTKTGIVFDAREAGRMSAAMRRKMADWIRDNTPQTRRTCVGFAYVLDSAILRGALTAILWLVPIPAPHTVVGTVSEAEAWLLEQLAAHGVRVTGSRFSLPRRA